MNRADRRRLGLKARLAPPPPPPRVLPPDVGTGQLLVPRRVAPDPAELHRQLRSAVAPTRAERWLHGQG